MREMIYKDDVIKTIMSEPTEARYPSWYADKIKDIPPVFKNSYEKLLPCICGCKRREHWCKWTDDGSLEGLVCMKCGKTVWGRNATDARREWNKKIMEELDGTRE